MIERSFFKNKYVSIKKNCLYRKIAKLVETKGFIEKIWFCKMGNKWDGRLYYTHEQPFLIKITGMTAKRRKFVEPSALMDLEILTDKHIAYSDGRNIICILIDHNCQDDPLSIFIHECIHYFYGEMLEEPEVLKVEDKMMKKLSWKCKQRILKSLLNVKELKKSPPIRELNKMIL